MIQQAEAIQAQQRDMVEAVKELAEVFPFTVRQLRSTSIGSTEVHFTIEASALNTVSEVCEKLRPQVCNRPGRKHPLQLLKDGAVLPQDATLSSLGISAKTPVDIVAPECTYICIYVQTLTGQTIALNLEAGAEIKRAKLEVEDKE